MRHRACFDHRGKHAYPSRAAARRGATAVARRNGDRRMPTYECPGCHQWFLTSKHSRNL